MRNKIFVSLVIICILFGCKKEDGNVNNKIANNEGISIDGLWSMTDVKKMCEFLGINIQKEYYYCLVINKGKGKVYFLNRRSDYEVKIKRYSDKYKMIYGKKKRIFSVKSNPTVNNTLYLYFDDSCPYPAKSSYSACDDGVLMSDTINNDSVKKYLQWVKDNENVGSVGEMGN